MRRINCWHDYRSINSEVVDVIKIIPRWYKELPKSMLRCPKCGKMGEIVPPAHEGYGQIKWTCEHLWNIGLNVG